MLSLVLNKKDIQHLSDFEKAHAINCSYLNYLFLNHLGYIKEDAIKISILTYYHDIGKIKVPQEILNKPSKLTNEEFEVIKQHSSMSRQCLSKYKYFKDHLDIIEQHHEKIDGSGYPYKLEGNVIRKEAKILAIIDIFEALTAERIYKKSISIDQSLKIIKNMGKDKTLDIDIIDKFVDFIENNHKKIHKIVKNNKKTTNPTKNLI